MRKTPAIRHLKWLLIAFWAIGAGFLFPNQIVKSSKITGEEYAAWISQSYDFRFGQNKPFAPSNATTSSGTFIAGEDFTSAARCATCHTDIHLQWRESAHANAFREPFYQKNVKDLIEQKDIAFTRHLSSFSKESPHPFYVRNKETCNSCHMQREDAKYFDASAKNGTIATRRWAAANTAIPTVYGYKDQLAAVEKNLQDDKMGVDIFALHRLKADSKKEKLIAPVNRDDFKLEENDTLTADVVVTNKNIGHSFPPELRDFYEAYVEFTVADASDKILYKSGFIKPDGYLDEYAHTYKTWLVKENGDLNDLHFIWKTKVAAQNNQIQSGRSDLARYKFTVPQNIGGQIKLTAKLRYRRRFWRLTRKTFRRITI